MTNRENFNNMPVTRRVLVAPLDWGLGHATRCIPIIKELIEKGHRVFIGASGQVKELLKMEFPDLEIIDLKGYNIRYAGNKWAFMLKLFRQGPGILATIRYERKWLRKVIDQYQIDTVISDSRMGLSHPAIQTLYITHQLKIQTGNRFTAWLLQGLHYHFIHHFDTCLVPDNAGEENLSGILSHQTRLPSVMLVYMGPLSRFERNPTVEKYELLILLSGPEPQRTLLEKILLDQLKEMNGKIVIVRGLPGDADLPVSMNDQIEMYNHLPSKQLEERISQSRLVITRSGYTTVMDLLKLQKKAILIPTPGQTEQEYLALYLKEKKIFYSTPQEGFNLKEAMDKTDGYNLTEMDFEQYKKQFDW